MHIAAGKCLGILLLVATSAGADEAPGPSTPPGFCGVGGEPIISPNATAAKRSCANTAGWQPEFASASIDWYWNWGFQSHVKDCVLKGWHFLPNIWGPKTVPLSPNNAAPNQGAGAPTYDMVPLLLGWNEPDIQGRCLNDPSIVKPSDGYCAMAGSMGWWFPQAINNSLALMSDWYTQTKHATAMGYEVASPMIAQHTDTWLKPFVQQACSASAPHAYACPSYLVFHFYAEGCNSSSATLQPLRDRLQDTADLMKQFPSIKGVLITEAGLSVPKGHTAPGVFPTCPVPTKVSLMRQIFQIMASYKGKDGASIVKHFAWFSKSGTPNHYDLSLLDAAKGDGSLSPLGSAYVDECKKWNAAAP